MSAATSSIRTEQSRSRTPSVSFGSELLQSRIGAHLREQRCPSCNSIVYTRRHRRCAVCEKELPRSFLFSCAEADKVDALLKTERQRHKAWLLRIETCG